MLYGETAIESHSVSNIAALQQHDQAESLRATKLMTNAAIAAAANPLPFRRVRNWLKCKNRRRAWNPNLSHAMLWSTPKTSARARRSQAPASDVEAHWDHEERSASRDPDGVDSSFVASERVYCDHERSFTGNINLSTAVRTEKLFYCCTSTSTY